MHLVDYTTKLMIIAEKKRQKEAFIKSNALNIYWNPDILFVDQRSVFPNHARSYRFPFTCFEIVSRVVHILKGTCNSADLKRISYIYPSKFDAKQAHRIDTKMYKVISILQAIIANFKNNKGAKSDCLFTRPGWSRPL